MNACERSSSQQPLSPSRALLTTHKALNWRVWPHILYNTPDKFPRLHCHTDVQQLLHCLCSEKANGRPLCAPLPAIRREKVYSPNHIWCFWSSCALKNADPSDWSNPDTGNEAVVRGGKTGVGRRPLEEVLAPGVWLHKEGQGCNLVFLHARWWTKAPPPPHSHPTNSRT